MVSYGSMRHPRTAEEGYAELVRWARELSLLASCEELLSWDEDTYMPRAGVANRGDQLALLAGIHHERATDPRIGEVLGELEGSPLARDSTSPEAANVRELRRRYDRWTRRPRKLVEEIVRTIAFAEQEWGAAFLDGDHTRFEPWLQRIVDLKRSEAEALGREGPPYDALLEEFEPGARGDDLARLFAALEKDLLSLAGRIAGASRRPRAGILRREFPVERQRIFGEAIATALGFDFHRGRLDVTIHPFFARIGPGDCRIATRYSADNFRQGFFAIIHEVWHALYEQGLDPAHHGTPAGEAACLGMHESQARLWENVVAKGRPFWEHFFPLAREVFHETLHDVSLDEFHFAVNEAAPTFIRAQADEVTYNLHVIIRFGIERALIAGDIRARDVPAAWNEGYRRHLGITPSNDREGCLQDGHWSSGMFGYFPTYTLGDIFGAQLLARARAEVPDLDGGFSKGDFSGLLGWLREKVHRHGHRLPAAKLIEEATGEPPAHRHLVEMLERKYGGLYGL
jgi:carboxypeptidase Taq